MKRFSVQVRRRALRKAPLRRLRQDCQLVQRPLDLHGFGSDRHPSSAGKLQAAAGRRGRGLVCNQGTETPKRAGSHPHPGCGTCCTASPPGTPRPAPIPASSPATCSPCKADPLHDSVRTACSRPGGPLPARERTCRRASAQTHPRRRSSRPNSARPTARDRLGSRWADGQARAGTHRLSRPAARRIRGRQGRQHQALKISHHHLVVLIDEPPRYVLGPGPPLLSHSLTPVSHRNRPSPVLPDHRSGSRRRCTPSASDLSGIERVNGVRRPDRRGLELAFPAHASLRGAPCPAEGPATQSA